MPTYKNTRTRACRLAGMAMLEAGMNQTQIAKHFGIAIPTVCVMAKKYKWKEQIAARKKEEESRGLAPATRNTGIAQTVALAEIERLQQEHRARVLKLADKGFKVLETTKPDKKSLRSYSENLDGLDKIARRNLEMEDGRMTNQDKGWGIFVAIARGEIRPERKVVEAEVVELPPAE